MLLSEYDFPTLRRDAEHTRLIELERRREAGEREAAAPDSPRSATRRRRTFPAIGWWHALRHDA